MELLADDGSRTTPDRLAKAHEVGEDGWTVWASFVVYPAESTELQAEARNIVLEADLLRH